MSKITNDDLQPGLTQDALIFIAVLIRQQWASKGYDTIEER